MATNTPTPLSRVPVKAFRNIRALLFDVDDTLTSHGVLTAQAYAALWKAQEHGLWLCAVTGRGAGWCDMMVRLWPVHAVVGETGAFVYEKDARGRVTESFLRPAAQRQRDLQRRDAAFRQVLRSHAGARLSRDSAFRLCDQALDLVEDGPVVPDAQARSMMAQLQARGLTVARSSVHINAWVGEYGKAQMVEKLLRRRKIALDQCAYAGDSRNDGPLFRLFPHSVGVANVRPLLPELASRGETPRYITAAPMGRGFSQLVQRILKDQPQRRGARA